MLRQIFYKELIKLRLVIIVSFAAHALLLVYMFITLRRNFEFMNTVELWLGTVEKDYIFFSAVKLLTVITSLAIGFFQFLSEVEKKRFRISCHLPMNENLMMTAMTGFGLSVVLILGVMDFSGVMIISSVYYPAEIVRESAFILLNYVMCGVLWYAAAVIVTLEPGWGKKAVLASAVLAADYLFSAKVYGSDRPSVYISLAMTAVMLPLVLYPAHRFRKGAGI